MAVRVVDEDHRPEDERLEEEEEKDPQSLLAGGEKASQPDHHEEVRKEHQTLGRFPQNLVSLLHSLQLKKILFPSYIFLREHI